MYKDILTRYSNIEAYNEMKKKWKLPYCVSSRAEVPSGYMNQWRPRSTKPNNVTGSQCINIQTANLFESVFLHSNVVWHLNWSEDGEWFTQRTQGVIITSLLRQNDVAASFRRNNDVIRPVSAGKWVSLKICWIWTFDYDLTLNTMDTHGLRTYHFPKTGTSYDALKISHSHVNNFPLHGARFFRCCTQPSNNI